MRYRWLIRHGVQVTARVDGANNTHQTIRPFDRRQAIFADLIYAAPDGRRIFVQGLLTPRDGILYIGETIPLRIDPDNPEVWTDRLEPPPLLAEMTAVLFLLPLLALAVLMLFLVRRRTLNIWRRGEPAVAVVVDTKQSSVAPRSRVMRFALRDSPDRRVFHTLAPNSMGPLEPGDEVMILHEPGKPARAVVAELYL